MAHVFADNIREGSTSQGTGNFVTSGGIPDPGGVIIGRPLSDVLDVGDTFDYSIFHTSVNEWEIGVGTYISANTFSRDPSSSSNNGNLVDFSLGTKQVFIAPVAVRMFDVISDNSLPQTQTGKTFTSTVTITGESGLRVVWGSQQDFSIGGTAADPDNFGSALRNTSGYAAWYVDTDKMSEGFQVRFHESGSNFRSGFNVEPDGLGYIGTSPIKVTSTTSNQNATSFPVGHTVLVSLSNAPQIGRNASNGVRLSSDNFSVYMMDDSGLTGDLLTGTWRARGRNTGAGENPIVYLMERVA